MLQKNNDDNQIDLIFLGIVVLLVLLGTIVLSPGSSCKANDISGAKIYKQYCASCHTGGGNTITAVKPIAGSQKLATIGVFKAYLTLPVGHMPYYKDVVDNDKLLKKLYSYCKGLKTIPKQS